MTRSNQQSSDIFNDSGDTGNPLLRWREYLHIMYERIWIAITIFVVVVISTVIWNERQVPMYKSRAELQFEMFANRILDLPDVSASGGPAYMFGQYINTQVRALRSSIFIESVVEALNASNDPVAKRFLKSTGNPVGAILSSTSVSEIEESQLVAIKCVHSDAEISALLANAVVEQFIVQDRSKRMQASLSALQWLKTQADDQKEKVSLSEMAIQKYREEKDMVSLEQHQDTIISKLQAISSTLTKAESEQTVAYTKWRVIVGSLHNGVSLNAISVIANEPQVVNAQKIIADIKGRIIELELTYKDKHPNLIAANRELHKARETYTKACLNARDSFESDYNLAKSNADVLHKSFKTQEQKALKLSRMMVEYNALKRNAEADQHLYQSIIIRMKQTDLAGKLETTNVRINDKAHVPRSPFTPQKRKNIISACGAGLVLGLVMILVVHMMDDRVRRIEDFELVLGIPVLAMIPKVKSGSLSERATTSFVTPESPVAEAFRGLYAGILLDAVSRDAKVIMVVSASASEGKSLVSANLASIFAQNGKRTLLIDADLRRPTQHKLFDVHDSAGLPHLILEKSSWKDALTHTPQFLLDLLTGTGIPSGNPARLIASDSMNRVLEEARTKYDRIIVDCPPLFGVSDPLILLPKVDGVILVALYNKTHRRAIAEASQKLMDSETPLLGAVINSVDLSSHSYYYHRYGYNHYYGEEAGEKGGKAEKLKC